MADHCACGCGEPTRRKGKFVEGGHDSTLRKRINLVLAVREEFGGCRQARLLEDCLPAVAYSRLGRCPECGLPNVGAHGKPRHD